MVFAVSYSLAFTQAIFVVLYVASKTKQGIYEFTPTTVISQDLNIPPSTAAMILRRLSRAGLIETREGANGGVRLAYTPENITILDVFSAIEQERPLFHVNIELNVTGEKSSKAKRAINQLLKSSETALKSSLQTVTIDDLINDSTT